MYPYLLLSQRVALYPIFGTQTIGNPAILDYSTSLFYSIDPTDQENIDAYNSSILQASHSSWALGGYLEDRSHILTGTHIKAEGRTFHLGVDIVLPAGTNLYSPLGGVVYERGYEPGDGNYGGYIIIRYIIDNSEFFALYGHLSYASLTLNDHIGAGDIFGSLGNDSENGNWFEHLHLQVFTGQDLDIWKNRGYCSHEDLSNIRNYCPDPSFLIRY